MPRDLNAGLSAEWIGADEFSARVHDDPGIEKGSTRLRGRRPRSSRKCSAVAFSRCCQPRHSVDFHRVLDRRSGPTACRREASIMPGFGSADRLSHWRPCGVLRARADCVPFLGTAIPLPMAALARFRLSYGASKFPLVSNSLGTAPYHADIASNPSGDEPRRAQTAHAVPRGLHRSPGHSGEPACAMKAVGLAKFRIVSCSRKLG